MGKKYLFRVLFLAAFFVYSIQFFALAKPLPAPDIEHQPVLRFMPGEPVILKARCRQPVQWMKIFYRRQGETQFSVEDMTRVGDFYSISLDSSDWSETSFAYYLSCLAGDVVLTIPENAPADLITCKSQAQATGAGTAEAKGDGERFPVSLGAGLDKTIWEQNPAPGRPDPEYYANLSIFPSLRKKEGFSLIMNSNLSYTNTPLFGMDRFDLSFLLVSLSTRSHILEAGDLAFEESEFTIQGLGRRGLSYTFDNRRVYMHLFDLAAQQLRGVGIPQNGSNIVGAAAGYRLAGETAFFRVIALSGEDDPSLGVNIGFSGTPATRKGSVIAVTGESRLWKNALYLNFEFAHSLCDVDIKDSQGAVPDNAFKVGGVFTSGFFSAGVHYGYLGNDFNSIGLPFVTSDREGVNGLVTLTKGAFSLMGSISQQQDNVEGDVASETTRDFAAQLTLTAKLTEKFLLSGGYRNDRQKTYLGDVQTSTRNGLLDEFFGTLSLQLGQASFVQLSLLHSQTTDYADPGKDQSMLALNASAHFQGSGRFRLDAVVGYQGIPIPATGEKTYTINPYFNGEYFLLPHLLSLSGNGSFMKSTVVALPQSKIFIVGVGLNLYLDRLVRVGSIVASLHGETEEKKGGGVSSSEYRLFLKGQFSF